MFFCDLFFFLCVLLHLSSQPLTSWVQRQKHRQRKSKTAQNRSPQLEGREEAKAGGSPKEHMEHVDEVSHIF